MLAAKLDGSISVWKNASDSLHENKLTFTWHASRCGTFAVDDEFSKIYSSGKNDGMLI